MKPPQLWGIVCQQLGLTTLATRRWWDAVARSQFAAPVSLRQAFLLAECRRWSASMLAGFLAESFSPQKGIEVCEALAHEQLLSRSEASVLEQVILAQTGPDGAWKRAATG